MKKTLWVVSGGIEAVPGIICAKEMGLHVVVSDGNKDAPGFKYADDTIVVSTYDVEASKEAAIEYNIKKRFINGVICMSADVPITVASIACALNLPSISMKTAIISADKLLMKNCFVEGGVPIPWFSSVKSYDNLKEIVRRKGFPLIIKPVDNRGARGVLRLTANVNLWWAYNYALEHSASKRVIVEEYLEGLQISTETIILNGKAYTPGFSERNYEFLDTFAPYVIENGGQQPPSISFEKQFSIKKVAEKAARVMGINNGIAKGDIVLTKKGPKVIEMAARLSGGWFSSHQIPIATGVNIIKIAICIAIGIEILPQEIIPKYNKAVAIRYFFAKHGCIKNIKNIVLAKNKKNVHELCFFVQPGDIVKSVTDHTKRLGFVITSGETKEDAVKNAEFIVNLIEIEII